jgi:hypothetical protein
MIGELAGGGGWWWSGSSKLRKFLISGFRREVDKKCALLGYYAANSGNFLPTFRDSLSVPSSCVNILDSQAQRKQ